MTIKGIKIAKKTMFQFISSFLVMCGLPLLSETEIKSLYYRQFCSNAFEEPFINAMIMKFGDQCSVLKDFYSEPPSYQTFYEQNQDPIVQDPIVQDPQISMEDNEASNILPPDIILDKTLVFPDKFLFFYLHQKNVERNIPGSRGNRYNDNKTIQFAPNIVKLKLPFPYVYQYMYGILSFIPQYWYHIIEKFFNLPCYHTAVSCRKRIQQREEFSLEILKSTLFSKKEILSNYIQGMWKTSINDLKDNRFILAIDAASLKELKTKIKLLFLFMTSRYDIVIVRR